MKDKNRFESKSYDMDKKLIYEVPNAELLLVWFEENILSGMDTKGVTLSNPWASSEEEEEEL